MGVYVDPNGTTWHVLNGTEPKAKPQIVNPAWRDLAVLYARAWVAIERKNQNYARPERMRVVEFNNSIIDGNTSTYLVENEDVHALYNENVSRAEFTYRWFVTARRATDSETLRAKRIATNTSNITVGVGNEERESRRQPVLTGHDTQIRHLWPMLTYQRARNVERGRVRYNDVQYHDRP